MWKRWPGYYSRTRTRRRDGWRPKRWRGRRRGCRSESSNGHSAIRRTGSGRSPCDWRPVERPGLEGIARAIGTERLRGQLGGSEPERLGAARLLLAEASPAGLRSVSGLSEDPSEEVRRAAAAAIHLLGQYRGAGRPDAPAGVSSSSPAPWTLGSERIEEPDLIASLARALADPEAAVRSKASVALERLPRRMVADWAVEALEGGSADAATKAASVVEHLGVLQAAESLLKRASGLP